MNASRCPATNECATINDRAEPNTPAGCCDDLEPGMQCQPWCVRNIQNDETALSSEVGFYWHFDRDADGKPSGCPCFDDNPKWTHGILHYILNVFTFSLLLKTLPGKKKIVEINEPGTGCSKEDYAPEGEPLYKIVDELAASNDAMMKEFAPAMQIMIENGYKSEDLTEVPTTWWFEG